MFRRWSMLIVSLLGAGVLLLIFLDVNQRRPRLIVQKPAAKNIKASGECANCHERITPAIVKQYQDSRHAREGVTCLDCHQASDTSHKILHNGFEITRFVTSGACRQCHDEEYKEFERSRHGLPAWSAVAGIGDFTPQQLELAKRYHPGAPTERGPNTLAQLEGMGAVENGCAVCHEIGKPNYDGSLGDCSKCHGRHEFSIAMARTPETCGSCHMGPDHSQLEIYNESKHGIQFRVRRDQQDLTVPADDLSVAHQDVPTCSTCHMSGLGSNAMTHDVGERLTYYLFDPLSEKRPHADVGERNMKKICAQCHASSHVDVFYKTAELSIPSTNEKVLKAQALMNELRDEGLLSPEPFDEPADFLYFNIWHHWGRTIKHGSYMGGADFTQWHGNYELLKDWVELQDIAKALRHRAKDKVAP